MAEINTSIIQKVRDTLREIEESIYSTLKDVINKESDVLVEILTQNQMFQKGEDGKGLSIHPDYAQSTISIKLTKSQPTDRVTLKDSGDFYKSINIVAESDKFIIEAPIEYSKFLTAKYGQDILRIQDMEMKEFFMKFVRPELEKNINEIIEQNQI